jgi:dTDP-4-dehydrorhamnose 3,5-epimerase
MIFNNKFSNILYFKKYSPTYGHSAAEILSEENKKQLWIPEGFVHGFLAITKIANFFYKTTNLYNKSVEKTITLFDNHLKIRWPKINNFIHSFKGRVSLDFRF